MAYGIWDIQMNAPISPILRHIDDRGWLAELVNSSFGEIRHVYVTTCLPGVVKAWHCHNKQTDRFVLLAGRLLVGLHDGEETERVVLMPFSSVLVIPPGIWHGFTAIGHEEAVVLNCTDQPFSLSDELRRSPAAIQFEWMPVSR